MIVYADIEQNNLVYKLVNINNLKLDKDEMHIHVENLFLV